MKIEFDSCKDAMNLRKHGVSLALAYKLNWSRRVSWVDRRFCYGEERLAAIVPFGGGFYFVAYVERGNVRRVISVRKTTRKERMLYARNCQDF